MGIEIVVIDHHTARESDIHTLENFNTPTAKYEKEFIELAREYLKQPYDLILGDQDPDGAMAAALYALSRDKPQNIECMRRDLNTEQLRAYEAEGITRILALDWYSVYTSDLAAADKVIVINPVSSGLPHTLCATQIVYEAVKPLLKDKLQESALALAAMGIVSDYCVDSAHHILAEVAEMYPQHFEDLARLLDEGTLDRYSVFKTKFKELSEMAWSPYILNGDEGSDEMIHKILNHPHFSISGLLRGSPNHTVKYLRENWKLFRTMLDKEFAHFESSAVHDGPFIVYEPLSDSKGLVQKFSSIVADQNADSVVLVRIGLDDGRFKYSLRRRDLDIDLGAVVKEMGVGGGIPPAAGCTVNSPEQFERDFKARVLDALGGGSEQ